MNILRKKSNPRKRHIDRNDAGLTLMELMIAAGITAVSLVIIIQSVIGVAQLNSQTKERAMAAGYVSSVFEVLRSMPFDDMLTINPMGTAGSVLPTSLSTVGAMQTFEFAGLNNATIVLEAMMPADIGGQAYGMPFPISEEMFPDGIPNPLEVKVTMRAYTNQGRPFNVTATTLIADTP